MSMRPDLSPGLAAHLCLVFVASLLLLASGALVPAAAQADADPEADADTVHPVFQRAVVVPLPSGATHLRAEAAADGTVHAVWKDLERGWIRYASLRPGGITWEGPALVSANGEAPDIAVADGRPYIAYRVPAASVEGLGAPETSEDLLVLAYRESGRWTPLVAERGNGTGHEVRLDAAPQVLHMAWVHEAGPDDGSDRLLYSVWRLEAEEAEPFGSTPPRDLEMVGDLGALDVRGDDGGRAYVLVADHRNGWMGFATVAASQPDTVLVKAFPIGDGGGAPSLVRNHATGVGEALFLAREGDHDDAPSERRCTPAGEGNGSDGGLIVCRGRSTGTDWRVEPIPANASAPGGSPPAAAAATMWAPVLTQTPNERFHGAWAGVVEDRLRVFYWTAPALDLEAGRRAPLLIAERALDGAADPLQAGSHSVAMAVAGDRLHVLVLEPSADGEGDGEDGSGAATELVWYRASIEDAVQNAPTPASSGGDDNGSPGPGFAVAVALLALLAISGRRRGPGRTRV